MRQLRLVGLAEDGASLVLDSPTGESYRLPIDDRVRAACRGDLTRLGQIEIEQDNPLRPREIQMRVRAGESAEQVAASSGMPLDRVLRFAYPVLQERSRVIAQARTTKPHPPGSETLGTLVEERLVSRGTEASTLEWDAWRREDGRWTVRLGWRFPGDHGQGSDRQHSASWSLDLARRALQPEDAAAEQLSAAEFHARTITAVTPLAVAARAADQPPGRGRQPSGAADRAPSSTGAAGPAADGPAADGPGLAPDGTPAAGTGSVTGVAGDMTGTAGERDGRPAGGAGPDTAGRVPGRPSLDEIRAGGRRPGKQPVPGGQRPVPGRQRPSADGQRPTPGGQPPAPGDQRPPAAGHRLAPGGQPPDAAPNTGARDGDRRGAGRTGTVRPVPGRTGQPGQPREPAVDDPPAEEPRRVAAGGAGIPDLAAGGADNSRDSGEDDRARRATVPSWDDILLGVRRRH